MQGGCTVQCTKKVQVWDFMWTELQPSSLPCQIGSLDPTALLFLLSLPGPCCCVSPFFDFWSVASHPCKTLRDIETWWLCHPKFWHDIHEEESNFHAPFQMKKLRFDLLESSYVTSKRYEMWILFHAYQFWTFVTITLQRSRPEAGER